MAFVGIKKLIKEDKEETKRNTSAIVAEQIKAGLLAGLGKRSYPEDWQDTTTGRVTTPKTTTTTKTVPKTTAGTKTKKTVTGTPKGTENIARTISPASAPVSPLTQRFSTESVADRLRKSSNTVSAEDPWVNWLIENGHIDNTGRVQGKVTGPISKEAYRELEQNMSDYKARNRIAADTGTAFGNVQRNSPMAQYNSLSPDDKASFYRAGSDKVRDITSFAGAQQYVAGLGYDVSEAWQEMHKWDTTLKNHQKAGQEQNKRRQDLENMLPESGVIRQRLVHGAKVPFTERPDNYNDYSEEYDRQLYDFFYGKGEHDKIMKIGNRQQKEKLMDDLNEMWRNVDNGTFEAYDQQNRQITDNLLKEERANMLAEYAEDQKKQAEHDYNTAKNYQAFRDIYREKYGTTSTPYTGEDLGRTSFSMNELERGVHTTDADRIFSFLTGGKEYEAYQSMYVNGKIPGNRTMQVTDEYNFAMLMSPEEQNEFKEVYINDGKKAAEAYMAGLHSTGVLRERYSQYEKIRAMEFGGEFPITSVAASLMNDTANTIITPFRTAAGFLGYQGASDPNDVSYKPAMTSEYLQQGFTNNIRNKFGDTAAEAAGVALNTVQNIFRAVMTRGFGLADKAQEFASLALFGVDVFGKNTYKYLDSKKYSLTESYLLGGIDSAIEMLEEKIPTDAMLGGVGKSFWTNLRNSAISEWIQEGVGATAGEKAKGVLTGEDSERQRAVELFAEGMTDENGKKIYPAQMGQEGINLASGQARKEYVTDAARSAIAGLAGGGLGATYGGIVNTANNINLGRAINSGTNTIDGKTGAAQLAALAKESNDAEIREAGEKLDKKIAGGKGNPSNYSVGKLAGMLYQGTADRMQTVVQDTMVRSIRDQIMTGAQEAATRAADAREAEQHEITQQEAQHYAEIIAKSVLTGKNPTNTELQELSKSEEAIQAWKSFNTRERVADMAAEIRKEAAPMNSVMDTLGDLTSKVAKSRSAAAPDIDAAIKEAGGDTAAAIDNLQARRSDLISESFAGKMKDILKSDKGGKQSKNFLDDSIRIMLAAKTMAKTAPKTRLDSETAQKLFDAAREEFEAEDANRVLKQETVKPGEGKASFEGVEYGTKEWQQKVSGLSKTQRNQMGALGEIASRAGLKVTFINDAARSMINGYENNDGSIVINIAARNRSGLGHHMLTTMSHEMTHWLEQNSREGYAALRQFIVDGLRNSGTDVESRILQIMDNQNAVLGQYEGEESQGLSVNGAMAELVAQGCENLLSSETMMQELAEVNPSAFSKIKTFVSNFVARIRNAVKGMSGSLSYEARTLIGQTEQIAKLWSSARAEALARNAEEGTEAQAGTQYSMQQTAEQAQEMDTEEYRQIAEQEGLDAPQMLRYSMVGPRAGGDYAEMIRQARQMEKQGEDAETIFRETGARKGFRGHWWVTLDNQNIRMKENFDTDSLSQYAYDLADVMDAEELMSAYPQLGKVKVQAQEMGRAYAAYVKDHNTIVLNEEELKQNPGKMNVALRHEIQHVIQDIEGANGGANMSRWQDIISRNNLKEDPLDLYWRTAGELEANVTSKDGGTMPTREQYARAVAIEDYAPGLKGWKSRMEGRLNRHFSMADISAQDQEYAEAVASGNMKKATEMLMEKLKHSEDIIPYSAPHGYGGQHKTIARMIKEGTPEAVARAAQDLASYVPDNAVLVPMPPHEGTVTDDTDTMILARAIGQLTGRPVVNALASNPRESRYQAKSQGRKGLTAEEMGFRKIAELPEGTIPIFVDNVVGSGETAKAANLAMGGGITLAYAKGTRTQGIRGLKEANVTYDKDGKLIPLSQRFNPEIRNVKYSTQEAAYMDAAERGDTETAKKLMEAYAAGKGYTIRAYHGTGRADRVGTVFLPERATSGPMAFFTDNRSIAENYARDKQDTSIAYDEEYGDYFHQFRVPGKNGKTIPVGDLWKQLSLKEKREITEKAKHINWDEDVENIIFDPDTEVGNGGFNDWTLREKNGNAIETLIEAWLQGGDLYGSEAKFLDVLKMVGIENATWNDPNARHEKVYDVFLKIKNPFSTGKMYNQSFLDGLAEWWEEQDWDAYQKETASADPWDKNSRSVEDWIEHAERDIQNGKTHAWTSIPDAVTDYLKSLGYDGIQDTGGKNGGESHTVWIPFSSEQVKSADPVTYDDQGNVIPLSKRFNSKKTDIRYSTQEAEELPGAFSVQNATDMDVNNFMMGLQETSLDTLQEKTMLRQYKDLKTSLDVQRLKIDERTKELRKLEAKKDPNAKDRNDMIRLRNMLDTDTKKRDRLEEQIVKVTSSEGYAGLMYRQHRVMMDLANGKTADDVKRTISGIQSSIEGLDRQISEREAEIREMAESTPVKAIQAMINDKDLDRLAAYLRKTYNSKTSKQEIMQDMAAIRLKMANRQKVDDDIEALTRKLIGGVRGEGSVYLDLLRGMTITLSRDQVKELAGKDSGIAEVRRMLAGSGIKVKQGKAGGSLDANWNELCDMIPALNRDTNEKDQIDELIRFVQSQLQTTSGAAMYQDQLEDAMTEVRAITASVGMDMAQDPAAVRVVQRMMNLMAEMQRGMKGSAAELKKAREQLAEMSRQGAMAGRLSGDMEHNITSTIEYLNKLSEQSEAARWRKERVRLIEQLKSETTEKLLQEQAKWKARIEKDKTVRGMMNENMSLRKKIHTNVSRIQKLLVNETDLKNIPEHMKGLARLMVGKVLMADMSGGRKITGLDPRDMAEIMRVIQAQIEIDGQFDESDLDLVGDEQVKEEVAKALADIEDGISYYKAKGGKDIIANLQGMKNALTRLSEGVATITSIINSERSVGFWDRRMAIEDAAFDVMQDNVNSRFKGELAGRGSKLIRGFVESVGYGNMTPVYFFKNLRNRGMTHHWQEMENAEHRNGLLLQKAKAFVQELAQRTHYKDWAEKTITVNIGKPTEMTVQQAMEILAIWKREQIEGPENSTHLSEGGFVLKTDENQKGKLRRERSSTMPVRIGAAEIAEIEGKLTDEQKQYMEAMVGYLSNEMSDLGNEASMRMYGIKKYKEKYYFPMATWEGQTNARSDRGSTIGKDENRAAHKSWSKRRKNGAKSTLVIGSFTEDAVKHITEMINYNTLAPAIEALNKVLNFQVDYEGENMPNGRVNIRTLFARDYGKQALKYLETLMQDMNGGVAQDQRKSLRDRALSIFKKNAVAGSLSVAAQQPLSYVRAAMMLSPRDMAQALMPQYYRGSWAEMMKHSGVAVIKEMGRFDMNFGQSARDFVSPDTSESLPERVVDKLNILPTLADRMTWTRMWSACKIEQHRLHPEMDMQSDAFLDMVGERFNDVMRRTQVYDSVLVKSSNMRSPNLGMKVLTSFMAEPTVSLNVLEDAVRNARDKGGVALVAKAGATFALSAVLQALIKGIMGAGRSPDDKKTAEENFLYKWQTAFMSEANPLGLIPGYSDLIEVLKNGELTDDAMSAVGKLKTVIDKAGKAISGQGQGVYRDLEDTAGQLAQMFTNVPAKNIMRDVRAMLTWFRQGSLIGAKDFANRESSGAVKRMQAEAGMYQGDNLLGVINTWLGEAGYKTTNKAYYGRMYDAMQAGNDQEAADIREYLMLGKGVKEEDIDSGLRSQAKADSSLGEAERSEWLIDQGLMSGTNTITSQLKEGKISADEARKLMKQADPEMSADEIWWKVDQISWQRETGAKETRGKNYRLMEAVAGNKSEEINRVIKDMMAHGVTQKQIKDYMGDLKQEYLAADSKEKVRIRDAIQKVYKAIGLTAAEADKRIKAWKPAKENTTSTKKTESSQDTTGQWGRGNINLNKRKVIHNNDGTISTEESFSTNIDGKEVLLPTIIDGKRVSEEKAIQHYMQTGEYLGKFDTVKEAEEYAQKLHERQDWYYHNH